MKFRYFANVTAHVEYEVEAPDRERADELARDRLSGIGWDEMSEAGHEIGVYTDDGSWELVEQDGDI